VKRRRGEERRGEERRREEKRRRGERGKEKRGGVENQVDIPTAQYPAAGNCFPINLSKSPVRYCKGAFLESLYGIGLLFIDLSSFTSIALSI
jgi:hypothetical protein